MPGRNDSSIGSRVNKQTVRRHDSLCACFCVSSSLSPYVSVYVCFYVSLVQAVGSIALKHHVGVSLLVHVFS